MSPNLKGKICIVTGATKGIGKGIALQLGSAGATVYVTGRTNQLLEGVAKEIQARGGVCIPVQVDHSNDAEVKAFFEKVEKDQKGKLDLLVNNAYAAVNTIFDNLGKPFWTLDPVNIWDSVNNVGLRNHYLCTTYASRIMVANKSGLIINISSLGGYHYFFNVAYTVGKSGVDRMATDCAVELKKENVTMISLWPGAVKTEFVQENMNEKTSLFKDGETVEFSGMAVAHLAADPNVIAKTGRILHASALAKEYGFVDLDGRVPDNSARIPKAHWLDQALGK